MMKAILTLLKLVTGAVPWIFLTFCDTAKFIVKMLYSQLYAQNTVYNFSDRPKVRLVLLIFPKDTFFYDILFQQFLSRSNVQPSLSSPGLFNVTGLNVLLVWSFPESGLGQIHSIQACSHIHMLAYICTRSHLGVQSKNLANTCKIATLRRLSYMPQHGINSSLYSCVVTHSNNRYSCLIIQHSKLMNYKMKEAIRIMEAWVWWVEPFRRYRLYSICVLSVIDARINVFQCINT